jgi:hypothetical protein
MTVLERHVNLVAVIAAGTFVGRAFRDVNFMKDAA